MAEVVTALVTQVVEALGAVGLAVAVLEEEAMVAEGAELGAMVAPEAGVGAGVERRLECKAASVEMDWQVVETMGAAQQAVGDLVGAASEEEAKAEVEMAAVVRAGMEERWVVVVVLGVWYAAQVAVAAEEAALEEAALAMEAREAGG